MDSGNGQGANREVIGKVRDSAVPITNSQVHHDGTTTSAGTTSTVGTNTAGARVRWGELVGVDAIRKEVNAVHKRITTWQKNFFELPRNAAVSKEVLEEVTRLIKHFNRKAPIEPVAIPLVVVFLPLMLQKPARRSKNVDHIRYLKKRLTLWKEGRLQELMSEGDEIQKRLASSKKREEAAARGFTRLMMEGRVRDALKLVNADTDVCGVHTLTDTVRQTLEEKHPGAEAAQAEALNMGEVRRVEDVVFEGIDAIAVKQASRSTYGSGGPTKIAADTWKNMLCGSSKQSDELAEQIAVMARRICTEDIQYEKLDVYWACRLVPLMKNDDGVRPVGIGEVLRRIIRKCVLKVLSRDIQEAAGTLQTCESNQASKQR